MSLPKNSPFRRSCSVKGFVVVFFGYDEMVDCNAKNNESRTIFKICYVTLVSEGGPARLVYISRNAYFVALILMFSIKGFVVVFTTCNPYVKVSCYCCQLGAEI